MASFADVHYCIYADIVAGSEKAQGYANIIHGWPQSKHISIRKYRSNQLSILIKCTNQNGF